MQQVQTLKQRKSLTNIISIPQLLIMMVLTGALIHTGLNNYLLFHSIIEFSCIPIALFIFIIVATTQDLSRAYYITLLGISYGFIGGIDFLHTLAYKGMGVFNSDANLPTQLWIAARFLESISLLGASILMATDIKLKFKPIIYSYSIVSIALILSIFKLNIFPVCFIEGYGLTPFKIISEYVISAILAASLIIIIRSKKRFNEPTANFLAISIAITILSELTFTLYIDLYDLANLTGHILKFISFYFIFKAIVETNLKAPYNLLSKINKELEFKNSRLKSINKSLEKEIHDRVSAEQSLRESEERYRTFFELSPEAIIIRSGEKIVLANKAAVKLAGLRSSVEMIGKPMTNILWPHQDYREAVKQRTEKISTVGDSVPLMEQKLIRSDGVIIDAEVAALLFTFEGEPSTLIIVRDITSRKRAKELQKVVDQKKAELQNALELDKLKTEFFANLSHELRTPLNVILGVQQLMALTLNDLSSPIDMKNYQKYMKTMKQNCYRLLKLINNLIDITKIDSGFMNMNFRNCNIVSIVEDISLSVVDYAKNNGLSLIFDTDVEEKVIACDPDKIERIILNLLSNAIKFTPSGGTIFVTIIDSQDTVAISIKDTGVGIPESKAELIFERFRQADRLLSREREGSGIGLSLVKSLTEMHGGAISLKSQVGKGSEFIITLPSKLLPCGDCSPNYEDKHIQSSHVESINIEFSDIYS